eukprot:TRINITY_DN5803_c0_g1_i1.p1 TRINITY_DN5803_c0_g1~~TRINITY_DN5803_c0_g1_i1.p1  ORF type:complete len:464 (-),score=113.08 TRINITY_DN5803_c0_g1_i1:31-1422(-)
MVVCGKLSVVRPFLGLLVLLVTSAEADRDEVGVHVNAEVRTAVRLQRARISATGSIGPESSSEVRFRSLGVSTKASASSSGGANASSSAATVGEGFLVGAGGDLRASVADGVNASLGANGSALQASASGARQLNGSARSSSSRARGRNASAKRRGSMSLKSSRRNASARGPRSRRLERALDNLDRASKETMAALVEEAHNVMATVAVDWKRVHQARIAASALDISEHQAESDAADAEARPSHRMTAEAKAATALAAEEARSARELAGIKRLAARTRHNSELTSEACTADKSADVDRSIKNLKLCTDDLKFLTEQNMKTRDKSEEKNWEYDTKFEEMTHLLEKLSHVDTLRKALKEDHKRVQTMLLDRVDKIRPVLDMLKEAPEDVSVKSGMAGMDDEATNDDEDAMPTKADSKGASAGGSAGGDAGGDGDADGDGGDDGDGDGGGDGGDENEAGADADDANEE